MSFSFPHSFFLFCIVSLSQTFAYSQLGPSGQCFLSLAALMADLPCRMLFVGKVSESTTPPQAVR